MQKIEKITTFVSMCATLAVLTGCSFGNSTHKTEIQMNDGQEIQPQTEVLAPEDAPQKDELSQDGVNEPIEASAPRKTESPIEASIEASTPQSDLTLKKSKTFKITDRLVNWGFSASSGRKIDTIIVHSSYNAVGSDEYDLDDIINQEYKPAGVSPHYIIARDGKIYRLVADKNIAYHAGVSKVPDGRTNVNDFSLGIEVVETKSESPSSAQYASLKSLISQLKSQYSIKYVLGHSDIAPGRKDDPWNFNWEKIK